MDQTRRRIVTASTTAEKPTVANADFNPFHLGTKRTKAGYKRLGGGVIEEVSTGKTAKF